jgi:hypothetical protein
MPRVIDGEFVSSQGDVEVYSYPMTAGSDYVWAVEGGEILSGYGTNQVSVVWSTQGGSIAVKEINSDGCEGVEVIKTIEKSMESPESVMSFSIYPNPASDLLNFSTSSDMVVVRVVDVMGRVILEKVLRAGQTTLDISNIANGTYRVMATADGVTEVQTLVVGK